MNKLIYKKEDLVELRTKFTKIENIDNIKIATAFISNSDEVKKTLTNLSNNIKNKNNFEIYLSIDFSQKDKFEILSFLENIANVYIIPNLHAKAYYISGKEDFFAFGSSNLTNNGFNNNLELMEINENITKNEIMEFFEYCKNNSTIVTEEIRNSLKEADDISKTIENNLEVKSLYIKIDKIKNDLLKKVSNRPEYKNLEEFYFTEEDYETFNRINSKKRTEDINIRRDKVKEKLLNINKEIIVNIEQKYRLYNHWRKANIIAPSGARPSKYTNNSLEWLGIRYLRREVEEIVKLMRKYDKDDEEFGVNKFTCFQINLSYEENRPIFEIGIFHSVANMAYDRNKVIENLQNNKNGIEQEFEKVIQNLKNQNLKFKSYNAEMKELKEFDIDREDPSEFVNWYLNNVKDKCYSSIMFKYIPNDIRIKTKESIKIEILDKFKILKPLYDLMIG